MEIAKNFEFEKYERSIYERWEKNNCFKPIKSDKQYSIIMPPPNATGQLHLGHSIGLTIQDILLRYKRMQGFETLYVPGTDHAAIATESKVAALLSEKGIERNDLGREKFLEEVNKFVKGSQSTIIEQTKLMGVSADWSKIRYTMEEEISQQVSEIFINMYNDKLIYRDGRIVNWDAKMETTVSDDELEYVTKKDKFYYFQFGPVVIGTARPETKFKDEIIVVHPDDERYKDLIGKEFELDWIEGKIKAKVIADKCIDQNLGTGAMTITPAHSVVDFELAQKHNLKVEKIIDLKGNIIKSVSETCGGLSTNEARKKVVEILNKKGLLVKVDENYEHNVAVNYRGGGIIEPQVMNQWWLDVNAKNVNFKGEKKSFKEILLSVVKDGSIKLTPKRFDKIYFNWIENLQDWCLSRQIWFGHRIPAWFKDGEIKVQKEKPGEGWIQDEDTLDTWFSAGMWPFTALGYPNKELTDKFYPTSVLETGHDIIFFWVARMILMGTYVMEEIPFKDVYLHGMVVDKNGKKMSKSKGNGIDPREMIKKYGVDPIRLALVIGSTPGESLRLYEEKIANYKNFTTKVWNSVRFALMYTSKESKQIELDKLSLPDKWILAETQQLISNTTENLENFKLSDAGDEIYSFLKNKLCDWYLEISKVNPNQEVILYCIETCLKLLHPFIPMITTKLYEFIKEEELMMTEWPKVNKSFLFGDAKSMEQIIDVVKGIRRLKKEFEQQSNKEVEIIINTKHDHIVDMIDIIKSLSKSNNVTINNNNNKLKLPSEHLHEIDIYINLKNLDNIHEQIKKTEKNLEKAENAVSFNKKKLDNEKFVSNAPIEVIEKVKQELEKNESLSKGLKHKLNTLKECL